MRFLYLYFFLFGGQNNILRTNKQTNKQTKTKNIQDFTIQPTTTIETQKASSAALQHPLKTKGAISSTALQHCPLKRRHIFSNSRTLTKKSSITSDISPCNILIVLKCDVIILQTFPFESVNLIMIYTQLL